jgi:Tat protein translocase TatB subunit
MFGIGMPELLVILALALIVIGPKKLPELAKSLGRAFNEFKKATQEIKDSLDIDEDLNEFRKPLNDVRNNLNPAQWQSGSRTAANKETKAEPADRAPEAAAAEDGGNRKTNSGNAPGDTEPESKRGAEKKRDGGTDG